MAKNERTSPRIAKIAAKILDEGYEPTWGEIKSIAASVLTQTRDRKKPVKKSALINQKMRPSKKGRLIL